MNIPEIVGDLLTYALQGVLVGLLIWARWSVKKTFVPQEECQKCRDDFEQRLAALDSQQQERSARQKSLEDALARLPSRGDIHDLALAIKEFEGNMKALAQKVEGQGLLLNQMEKSIDRLLEVHIGDGK